MNNSDDGNFADGAHDDDVMSGVEQPIEENEISGISQQDNDDNMTSQTTRQSSSSMQKKRYTGNIAINSPKKAQILQTFGAEEDFDQVADLDELDELSDIVMKFEKTAFETKKRVNSLDRLTYKSQLLPPTLRLCYQALLKSWMQDAKGKTAKIDFDSENLEFLLSDSIKSSGNCIKEFSKFKGEFYALNEPIINKDISNLSFNFVSNQATKQQAQIEKLSLIEDQVSMNDGQIEELKNKFETFQSEKFDEKQRKIETEGQEVKELVAELDEKDEKSASIFKETKKLLKESRPQTKEQRSKHSDINSKLQKAERKYQKWKSNFDAHSLKQAELHDQIDKCQKIVENLEELAIKTMVAQSKKMQKLIDSSLAIAKYKLKLIALLEDLEAILREALQLQESCIEFQKTLLDDLLAEYQDLIDKIRGHSQNLEDEVLKINDLLSNFENKVVEMKISDQDHFFLNKEILRFRTQINSIDSQRGVFMEETEGIEDKFSLATNSLDSENTSPISQDDLQKLRDNLKQLQKQDEVEMPKIKKGVDGLEQYVMRSLKNQLNGDNKLSQNNISKVKKNYEEFLKMFEKLNQTYNDCVQKVNNFNGKFDSDDLERRNHLEELQERLREEEQSITGVKKAAPKPEPETKKDEDGINEVEAPPVDDADEYERDEVTRVPPDCLQQTKRQIIEAINGLVNQFNDITKILRDSSGKNLKTEGPLNDLISKNKQIQAKCDDTHELIDGAKKNAQDILSRLHEIINSEILDELMQKYRTKENVIDDCNKMKSKAEKQQAKIAQQLSKYIETVEEQAKKLDIFNPINGSHGTTSQNQEFLDEVSQKIDSTNELLEGLQKLRDDNQQISENIESACLPLTEVADRIVTVQELESILETLNAVSSDLGNAEADISPKQLDITKLQKEVKALIGQEVEGRLKEGQNNLDVIDQDLQSCNDIHNAARKRLKQLRDLVDKAQKQQGKSDPQLLEKLDEMMLEAAELEDMIGELDTKLNDQKRKKTEAKKQMEDMVKGMQGLQKFKPNQMEGVLSTLDELKDKNGWITEKLQNIENKMDTKLKDIEDIVSSCEKKQELQKQMSEAEAIMEEDLTNLRELLDKLPKTVKQLKNTIQEMSASAGPGDDFSEKKDELAEQLEELDEIEIVVDKFDETFGVLKDERDKLKKQKAKATDIQQFQKLLDSFQENKDALSGLFTDALDTQEQLEDLKKDVGDCDIPMLITKRKQELSQFINKGERLKKELLNLKKAKKKPDGSAGAQDDKIGQMLKELEFKLKKFDIDKTDLNKSQTKELDSIQPVDFNDIGKSSDLLKKIRKFKNQIHESEGKLKDLEEVQNDIVKKMTEQDLENSTDLLSLKAQELRDRLKESRQQLQQIQESGEAMDGNTSTNEEEEFIQAIKNEMPEVLDNIETNLGLLVEIEKLVPDVKQSMSLQKMNDLREKVEIATENVEESEGLVIKLEKEILEWNAQKKLCKRDQELEEARNLLNDYIDDLSQEKQNTEIELHRNREKQEENRGQEMVDKDGKKVDIMKDLERLEEEMMNYLKDIGVLLEEIQERDVLRDKLFEDFNKLIPLVIIEERKRRAEHIKSLKPPDRQLKRPPMLKKTKTLKNDAKNQDDKDDELWCPHQMLKTNCTFRNPIKGLLKDLKSFNQRRKDLEDKYAQMRREVFKIKQIKLYKPVQGDAVDEMFAGYLNKAKLTIEVQRISASNYMFGTKKILAKIINGRLVIRVGGGYMNAEEFIEQYGKIEMMKIMNYQEKEGGFDTIDPSEKSSRTTMPSKLDKTIPARRQTAAPSSQMMSQLGDAMKEKMRQQLSMVKAYDSQNTVSMKEKQKMRQTVANDSMKSLGASMRSKGNLNASSNKGKPMTAEEKARNKEAIGNLVSGLNNIKSNNLMNADGSSSARKFDSTSNNQTLSARGGSKSPVAPNSANQPNSGAKSTKLGALSRRSTLAPNAFGKK